MRQTPKISTRKHSNNIASIVLSCLIINSLTSGSECLSVCLSASDSYLVRGCGSEAPDPHPTSPVPSGVWEARALRRDPLSSGPGGAREELQMSPEGPPVEFW